MDLPLQRDRRGCHYKLGSVRALGEGSWHWKMMVATSFSMLGLFGLLRVDDHCSPGPLQE